MHYTATADSDIGIAKETNQDSLLVKHAEYSEGEILFAVICDGMGGLAKGELASATVIKAFSQWFEEELPYELENIDMQVIGEKWALLLKELNVKILEYGQSRRISLGTTFTGMLCIGDRYVITHVGDTRVYHIGEKMQQLTKDQTFIAREIERGTMTAEQAKTDKRRNMLLQCVGACLKIYEDGVEFLYHDKENRYPDSMTVYRIPKENINAVRYDSECHMITIIGEAELLAYDDYFAKRVNYQNSQRRFYSNSSYYILAAFENEEEVVSTLKKMVNHKEVE